MHGGGGPAAADWTTSDRTYTKVSGDRSEERVAFEVSIMSLAAEVPTEKEEHTG